MLAQIIFLVVALLLALGLVALVIREAAPGAHGHGHDDHTPDGHSSPPPVGPDGEDQTEDITGESASDNPPSDAADDNAETAGDGDADKTT